MHFDVDEHPAALDSRTIPSRRTSISLLNIVLPAAERWFVATYNEALPLVKDPKLAEDMRGFIGQEATHADVHDKVLHEFMDQRTASTRRRSSSRSSTSSRRCWRRSTSHRPQDAAEPPVRPAVADRRHRALHRGARRLLAELRVGRPRRRPDDGRPVPLARQRRGRAPHASPTTSRVYFHDSYVDRIRAMMMAVIVHVRRSSSAARGTWSRPTRASTSVG